MLGLARSFFLLPVASETYKSSYKHTERQSVKMKKEDIKEGYTYLMKDGSSVMYLGRHRYNDVDSVWNSAFKPVGIRHIFLNMTPELNRNIYLAETGFTKVAETISSFCADTYADELQKFKESVYYAELSNVEAIKVTFDVDLGRKLIFVKENDKYYPMAFSVLHSQYEKSNKFKIEKSGKAFELAIKNGTIKKLPEIQIPQNQYNLYNTRGGLTLSQMQRLKLYRLKVTTTMNRKFII